MRKVLAVLMVFLFFTSQAISQIDWEATIDVASSSFGNIHPRIVTDASGNPIVIWGKSNNLLFSRWNGTGFTNAITLNPDTISIAVASWMGPDIAAHGDTIYIVFKQTPESSNASPIWCIRSFDGGLSFSSPFQVDNIDNNFSRFPSVTTDPDGNPIIGFMKFDSTFSNPRWVVTKSIDFGNSFLPDVLASGWSNSNSEVCDCCPGTITSAGNNLAMLYRDNDNNIRDSWAGISNDLGSTFNTGMNIDQHSWMISACPSSGPDGIILGDTLYATYMSGASGVVKVYFSKSSLSEMTGSAGNLLSESSPAIGVQNFPRISNKGKAVALAWKQFVNGEIQLPILFTEDITTGLPSTFETIAFGGVSNLDLVLSSENIYIVWQDDNSGTVKFRSGTYSMPTLIRDNILVDDLISYPNPSAKAWTIEGSAAYPNLIIELYNTQGVLVYSSLIEINNGYFLHEIDNSNLISGIYVLKLGHNNYQQSIKLLKR